MDKATISQCTVAVSSLQLQTHAQQTADITNQSIMQVLDKGHLTAYMHDILFITIVNPVRRCNIATHPDLTLTER